MVDGRLRALPCFSDYVEKHQYIINQSLTIFSKRSL